MLVDTVKRWYQGIKKPKEAEFVYMLERKRNYKILIGCSLSCATIVSISVLIIYYACAMIKIAVILDVGL